MSIGEVLEIDPSMNVTHPWWSQHPHVANAGQSEYSTGRNALFVSSRTCSIGGRELPGAGVFAKFSPALCLTAPESKTLFEKLVHFIE
jgi:hypothetical protein